MERQSPKWEKECIKISKKINSVTKVNDASWLKF